LNVFARQLHSRIHFFLSCTIAFLLPFKQFGGLQIIPLLISLLSINWILEGDFRSKFQGIRYKLVFCIFILFYLLHVAGLAWSVDKEAGVFDLQVKFSLFLFPWIFATRPFNTEKLDRILSCFLLGCASASVLLLLRATYIYAFTGENSFFYEQLSFFMHPSYFSMYLNLALIYLLFCVVKKENTQSKLCWILIPLFVVVIILLSSKLGLISLLLILATTVCYVIFARKKYLYGIAGLGIMVLGIAGVLKFSPAIYNRVNNAVQAMSSDNSDKTKIESTAVRKLIWGASRDVISEHPFFGTGTGDSKAMLMQKYKQEGITGALKKNLNSHNAYLQILVSLGITGFLLFLGMLFLPLIIAWREGKPFFLCFILLMALNFIPESMLETQAGVMYYAFFNCMLLFSEKTGFGLYVPQLAGSALTSRSPVCDIND